MPQRTSHEKHAERKFFARESHLCDLHNIFIGSRDGQQYYQLFTKKIDIF